VKLLDDLMHEEIRLESYSTQQMELEDLALVERTREARIDAMERMKIQVQGRKFSIR
jgi:hypothetical protein